MMQLVSENKYLAVKVNSRKGFTTFEESRHHYAASLIAPVVNTKEFVERVLAMRLTGLGNLTRQGLINLIFSGSEILSPESDNEIDVDVVMYYSSGRVVGYTNPGTITTWVNKKFFSQYGYAEIACNLFHEWLHKLGFDHRSASDLTSVPYALGYLIEDMINEYLKGAVFTPLDGSEIGEIPPIKLPPPSEKVLVCYRSWRTLFMKRCYWEYPYQGQCHRRR